MAKKGNPFEYRRLLDEGHDESLLHNLTEEAGSSAMTNDSFLKFSLDISTRRQSPNCDDFPSLELRPRSRPAENNICSLSNSRQFQDVVFDANGASENNSSIVERKIQDGETLQKLALQYGVSISDLKRVNGLISDQDFYGLSALKIPVMKYSHTEETLLGTVTKENLHQHQTASEDARSDTSELLPLSDSDFPYETLRQDSSSKNVRRSEESLCSNEDKHNFNKILKNVDANLVKAKDAAEQLEQRQEQLRDEIFNASNGHMDDMYHLTGPRRNNSIERTIKHYVILILIVFAILVPVGYVLYRFL